MNLGTQFGQRGGGQDDAACMLARTNNLIQASQHAQITSIRHVGMPIAAPCARCQSQGMPACTLPRPWQPNVSM